MNEAEQRLAAIWGTCITCGAPRDTRLRMQEDGGSLEELVCTADPEFEDERHQRGEILLREGVDFDS